MTNRAECHELCLKDINKLILNWQMLAYVRTGATISMQP